MEEENDGVVAVLAANLDPLVHAANTDKLLSGHGLGVALLNPFQIGAVQFRNIRHMQRLLVRRANIHNDCAFFKSRVGGMKRRLKLLR